MALVAECFPGACSSVVSALPQPRRGRRVRPEGNPRTRSFLSCLNVLVCLETQKEWGKRPTLSVLRCWLPGQMPEPRLILGGDWEGGKVHPGAPHLQHRAQSLPPGAPHLPGQSREEHLLLPAIRPPSRPPATLQGKQSGDFQALRCWQQPGSGVLSQLLPAPPQHLHLAGPPPGQALARHLPEPGSEARVPAQMLPQLFQPPPTLAGFFSHPLRTRRLILPEFFQRGACVPEPGGQGGPGAADPA